MQDSRFFVLLFCFLLPLTSSATAEPFLTKLDREELEFLQIINEYRDNYGLEALSLSDDLTRAAKWFSYDMSVFGFFRHEPDSRRRSMTMRLAHFGYSYEDYATTVGENIAAGNASAEETFTQWKNSPGHNANMLSAKFKVIGIGRFFRKGSRYGWYWTTDFGGFRDR